MHAFPLTFSAVLLAGCAAPDPAPSAPAAPLPVRADTTGGRIDLSEVKFTNELVAGMVPARMHTISLAQQPDWRVAVDSLDRYDAAHREDVWHPQVMLTAADELLRVHFAHPPLTPEQAVAAGRYAGLLLRYTGLSSDGLNRAVVALLPHWPPEQSRVAAETLLARRHGGPRKCGSCDETPAAIWEALDGAAGKDR